VEGLRCFRAGRSSCWIFVELFHAGRLLLSVAMVSSLLVDGEDSGVRLCECLWEGVIGVGGGLPKKWNIDARCRRVRVGSEDGSRDTALCGFPGVSVAAGFVGDFEGDLFDLAIFRANLRNGEMDRDNAFELGVRSFFDGRLPLGGVTRYPFFDCDVTCEPAPDVLDPASLEARSPLTRSLRIASISLSVLAIRSFKLRHRCVDSAWRRKHSPFFVTRS